MYVYTFAPLFKLTHFRSSFYESALRPNKFADISTAMIIFRQLYSGCYMHTHEHDVSFTSDKIGVPELEPEAMTAT